MSLAQVAVTRLMEKRHVCKKLHSSTCVATIVGLLFPGRLLAISTQGEEERRAQEAMSTME